MTISSSTPRHTLTSGFPAEKGPREPAYHILVTGGAGFIGSHLVDRLLENGHAVTVVDNFDPFYSPEIKAQNLAAHHQNPRFRLVQADIRDLPRLEAALVDRYGAIYHLAARAGVRASLADPEGYWQVNVVGTQNLLEFARARAVPRFIFASSSSVYGVNPEVPWRETGKTQPISPYAETKLVAEKAGQDFSQLYGIRFIALRFFTVYGPRQRPDLAIHKFARLLQAGRPLPFFGDGETRRDYTYIDDIVDGLIAALSYNTTTNETFNLGNDFTVSLAELVAALEATFKRQAQLERMPLQPGDVPQTWADISKAHQVLGYNPRTSFATGLAAFRHWLEASDTSSDRVWSPKPELEPSINSAGDSICSSRA